MKNNNDSTDDISLSGFRFFKSLTEEELKSLNFEKTCTTYKKGSIVYKEGSRLTGFYCVIRGIVKVYKTGIDGKEMIIPFSGKPDDHFFTIYTCLIDFYNTSDYAVKTGKPATFFINNTPFFVGCARLFKIQTFKFFFCQ